MYRPLLVLLSILLPLLVFSQKEIQLLEREVNGSTILSAKNNTKTDYEITVHMEHSGVDLSRPLPYTIVLKAGKTEELITVTPQPGKAWSYNTSLAYKPIVEQRLSVSAKEDTNTNQTTAPSSDPQQIDKDESSLSETSILPKSLLDQQAGITEIVEQKGLTLLIQPGCGRSHKVIEAFKLYRIPYEAVEIKTEQEFSEIVSGIGKASGVSPQTASSPVVVENGIPTYDIENLDAFIEEMKKKYGSTDHISKDPGITLYTKPGCGRCVQAKEYLRSLDVSYQEVDLSKKSSAVDAMWDQLRAQGFKGNSVQTPIVLSGGRLYHEIPDIRKFLSELVTGDK